jgi:hypothetical protein
MHDLHLKVLRYLLVWLASVWLGFFVDSVVSPHAVGKWWDTPYAITQIILAIFNLIITVVAIVQVWCKDEQ